MVCLYKCMSPAADAKWLLIKRVLPETHDVTTIVTEPARDHELPAFAPGQFCMLAAVGAGEIPISISGDPSRRDRLTFTIRAAGASSSALAGRRPGELISMRGPLGNGWPLKQAVGNDLLLIGGGMGLAALRPVIYAALQDRSKFGRLTILNGARTPADLIYTPQLADWDRLSGTQVLSTVDVGSPSWHGHTGLVTQLLDRLDLRPASTIAMICGPDRMMQSTARELETRGFSGRRIFLSMPTVGKDGPVVPYSEARRVDALCDRKVG